MPWQIRTLECEFGVQTCGIMHKRLGRIFQTCGCIFCKIWDLEIGAASKRAVPLFWKHAAECLKHSTGWFTHSAACFYGCSNQARYDKVCVPNVFCFLSIGSLLSDKKFYQQFEKSQQNPLNLMKCMVWIVTRWDCTNQSHQGYTPNSTSNIKRI